MNNIILIGMPSSGKSTLGVLLAKLAGYDFIDTDLLIQKRAGKRLQCILDEDGKDAFMRLEEEVLCSLATERTVIATGGSAVYHPEAMTHLASLGKIVYLRVPYAFIERRLQNLATRGVVMAKGETLASLYASRAPLYEKYAALTLDEGKDGKERDMSENAAELLRMLEL